MTAHHLSTNGRGHSHGPRHDQPDPVAHNVDEILKLQQRDRLSMDWSDHLADRITAFSGSMLFFYLNALWFAIWIPLNLGWFGIEPFDPFPFGLLTMIVSLEAIFLATFVLISQNRQALQADRRQKVNMQVDMLAEQEVTKLIHMVAEIQDHLGILHPHDEELKRLGKQTHIEKLADAIDQAEHIIAMNGPDEPRSAVNTER